MLARIIFVITFFVLVSFPSLSQVSIIPEPVSLQQKEGSYSFKNNITIGADASAKKIADWLKEKLSTTGLSISIVPSNEKADIVLLLNKTANTTIGKEGYQLSTSANDGIKISANEPAGLFYGAQTFLQLLPSVIESKTPVKIFHGQSLLLRSPTIHVSDGEA